MDFIDVVVSPSHVDDDVFVNLDAFDMLSDFPELEVLEAAAAVTAGNPSSGAGEAHNAESQQQTSSEMVSLISV